LRQIKAMKVCPSCAFSNEECFPTCVYCNAVIVDVPSMPSAGPDSSGHEWRAMSENHRKIARGRLRSASAIYALAIALLAVLPGLTFSLLALGLYFLSGIVVAVATVRNIVGQFSACLLQGMLSVVVLIYFVSPQPFIFIGLLGQIVSATLFWHWSDMIRNAHR
jgi:hypothetical protein